MQAERQRFHADDLDRWDVNLRLVNAEKDCFAVQALFPQLFFHRQTLEKRGRSLPGV